MRINRHMYEIVHYAERQTSNELRNWLEWVKLSDSDPLFPGMDAVRIVRGRCECDGQLTPRGSVLSQCDLGHRRWPMAQN